jgi:hypothetical protein
MNITYEEQQIEDPCKEMARLAENFLPLAKWNFDETYRSVKDGRLIYDSQWCRVKFIWSGWETQAGNSINIFYGRTHALNDHQTMIWNQENCYCWHGLTSREVLNFLDGLSPQEAASQKDFPQTIMQFRKSELWQSLSKKRCQPELTTRMNAAIWEHYDVRLFELFDLRHFDLWEQYRKFLKDFYDIKGRSPNITPSLDKVC